MLLINYYYLFAKIRDHPRFYHPAAASGHRIRRYIRHLHKTARRRHVSHEIDIKDRLSRCLSQKQLSDFKLPTEPPAWSIEKEKYPYHIQSWKDWLAASAPAKIPSCRKWSNPRHSIEFIAPVAKRCGARQIVKSGLS